MMLEVYLIRYYNSKKNKLNDDYICVRIGYTRCKSLRNSHITNGRRPEGSVPWCA